MRRRGEWRGRRYDGRGRRMHEEESGVERGGMRRREWRGRRRGRRYRITLKFNFCRFRGYNGFCENYSMKPALS